MADMQITIRIRPRTANKYIQGFPSFKIKNPSPNNFRNGIDFRVTILFNHISRCKPHQVRCPGQLYSIAVMGETIAALIQSLEIIMDFGALLRGHFHFKSLCSFPLYGALR